MTIAPIPTRYAGCRFRSRLEARWAVFFDTLNLRWEYEPEGFRLPSGPYLPDFRLHGLAGDGNGFPYLWFEVKPDIRNADGTITPEDSRWSELSADAPLVVAFGLPRPDQDLIWGDQGHGCWMELYGGISGWDNGRTFAFCPWCDRLGIVFEGRGPRICNHKPGEDKHPRTHDDPRIVRAYVAANSARFEHGESP